MCITQELSKKLGKYFISMINYLNYHTSTKPLLLKKKWVDPLPVLWLWLIKAFLRYYIDRFSTFATGKYQVISANTSVVHKDK